MSCKAGFLLDLFLSDSRLRGRVNEWTPFFIFLSFSSSLCDGINSLCLSVPVLFS